MTLRVIATLMCTYVFFFFCLNNHNHFNNLHEKLPLGLSDAKPARAGVKQCCGPCRVCGCHPILRVKPRLEGGKSWKKRERERKTKVREITEGKESLLISTVFQIVFGIRHPGQYSRKRPQRTREHLKELIEWVRQPSKLCERGHKRGLCQDPTTVVCQCQMVPRTSC